MVVLLIITGYCVIYIMFRHLGSKRTYLHNLRLATLLCFTAGIVNGAGFLAFMVLTTNVTGHAALLAVRLAKGDFHAAGIVALWLIIFFVGSFFIQPVYPMGRAKQIPRLYITVARRDFNFMRSGCIR